VPAAIWGTYNGFKSISEGRVLSGGFEVLSSVLPFASKNVRQDVFGEKSLFNVFNWQSRSIVPSGGKAAVLPPRIKTSEYWNDRTTKITDIEAVRPLYEADVRRLWSPHELTKSQNTTRDVQLIEYLREDLRSNTDMGLNGEYRSSNFKLRNGSTKATIGFAELIANGKYKLYKAFSGNKPATRGGYENYLDSKHLPSENLNQSNRSTDVEPKILESILLETTPATEGMLVGASRGCGRVNEKKG
jgi:hypothetical protein